LRKIKETTVSRSFFAYLLMAVFVVSVPVGVATYSAGAGLISLGCCAFVVSYLLGAD
jgi:hypothetical protein